MSGRELLHLFRLETVGKPLRLPPDVVAAYPALAEARWRVGGFPLRVGGWLLGHRSVAGITLGSTIFLADAERSSVRLLLHEVAHVRQFRRDKAFPIRYLWDSICRGYTRNRYEIEADRFAERVLWSSTLPRPS